MYRVNKHNSKPQRYYPEVGEGGRGGDLVMSSRTIILHFMSHETNSVIIDL